MKMKRMRCFGCTTVYAAYSLTLFCGRVRPHPPAMREKAGSFLASPLLNSCVAINKEKDALAQDKTAHEKPLARRISARPI